MKPWRELFFEVGGERTVCDGSQDHDLFLRLTERLEEDQIVHIPQVLYYWRVHGGSTSGGVEAKPYVAKAAKKAIADHLERTGQRGTVRDGLLPSTYKVDFEIEGEPLVSILIPLVYRFGPEKSRFILLGVILLPTLCGMLLQSLDLPMPSASTWNAIASFLPAIAVAAMGLSCMISCRIVEKKDY